MALMETPPILPPPPKFVVVEWYQIFRIGLYARATVQMTQCDYWLLDPLASVEGVDTDEDGLYESLTIPLHTTSLVGHILSTVDSVALCTVTAQVDGETTTTLSLSVPLSDMQLAAPMHPVAKMVGVGTTAYVPAPGGRSWTIHLNGENPQSLQRLVTMLGSIGVSYGMHLCAALGVNKTQAEVQAAVVALAGQGTNIDGLYALQGEGLEANRRAGTLTYAQVLP